MFYLQLALGEGPAIYRSKGLSFASVILWKAVGSCYSQRRGGGMGTCVCSSMQALSGMRGMDVDREICVRWEDEDASVKHGKYTMSFVAFRKEISH